MFFLLLPLLWRLLCLPEATCRVVLDPALFLAPSPPLTPSRYALTAVEVWTETLDDKVAREAEDVSVLPLRRAIQSTTEEPACLSTADLTGEIIESALSVNQPSSKKTTRNPEINDARSSHYGLEGIHIPITFAISGNYGRYGVGRPSLVASSYGTADLGGGGGGGSPMRLYGFGNNGKPALAGSSYNYNSMGSLPIFRTYGSSSGPSWSGWGNGKWGHYGKG